MAAIKKTVAAAVGAGALVLAAGALVYEGALNTKINRFFVSKFDKPDPEQTSLYEGDAYTGDRAWFHANKGEDLKIRTQKTGDIHAYVIPAGVESHKWAILCHGYNSEPASTAVFARHYHALGYHCVCPSLRGWGEDETSYCSMGYRDKDLCMAWIEYVCLLDPAAEIVLHGYSMGAVTVMLATGESLPANVKAAVADCGFTACYELFGHVVKSYAHLPPFPLVDAVNLVSILRGNFNVRKNVPLDAVRRSVTPTAFLHGTADDFVPFSMMARLYEACAAPKVMQPIEGGLHATAVLKDPALYWKTVDGFLADKIRG